MARTTNRKVCLPDDLVEQIKKADLANRSPEDRMFVFKSLFGEQNGLDMARLFNKSLLLKNQEKSLLRFIDNAALKLDPEKKAALKREHAEYLMNQRLKMYNTDGTINSNFIDSERTNEEIVKYAKKILDKKYGFEINKDIVQSIQNIKNELPNLKKLAQGTAPESEQRLAYGLKLRELKEIFGELSGEKLKKDSFINRIKKGYSENVLDPKTGNIKLDSNGNPIKIKTPISGTFNALGEIINTAFNPALKSIKASLDNSGFSRQGIKILMADKNAWWKQFGYGGKSWKTLGQVFKKDGVKNLKEARIAWESKTMADDFYDDAVDSGLAIIGKEDFFPESNIVKLPQIGKFFMASDDAYTIATQESRFDIFKKYVKQYTDMNGGVKPSKEIMKGFARVANSATGRGGLGSLESSAGLLNKFFFSARFQTAQINTFKHAFDKSLPIQARKIAQKNLANYLMYVGGLMAGFSLFADVGLDPRENTFGKVRLFDSDKWVDVTGGTAPMVSTLFRTGAKGVDIISGNKTKYGQDNAFDLLVNFVSGKLAPVPGTLVSIMKERKLSGDIPLPIATLMNLFVPIGLQQPIEDYAQEEELNASALGFILEFIGSGTSKPSGEGQRILDIISGR